jgi:hypothetical protein
MFRIEVLGAQVPDVIAERIFCAFATCISKQKQENMRKGVVNKTEEEGGDSNQSMDISVDGMCFEDIMACFIVFKTYKENEISQVVYEMMKLDKDQQAIGRDDILHFCKRIA